MPVSRSTAPATRENVYLVDGVNTTNIQNGGVGKNFQMDFVEEVQVKTSSFEAEFGGALGGVINAVAKRGSNNWHGSLVTYYQANALNANNGDRGLRINPAYRRCNTTTRLDGTPEYFSAKKDQRTIVEPGYTVGGALREEQAVDLQQLHPEHRHHSPHHQFHRRQPGTRGL